MANEAKTQLFISHHSSKLSIALELEEALAKYGVTCWLAPRDVEPSEAFDMAIKRAIDGSCAILLLFCSKSDKSPHVKRELILADSSRKAIIPMRLEELDPDELAYHLANSQWIDWLEQRESTIERVAAKAHQLAGTSAKTMSVDDLIERTGIEEPQGQQKEPEPDIDEPMPFVSSEPEAAKSNINWTLIIAIIALLVAILAAVLIWNGGLGSGDTETITPQVEDSDEGEKEPETEAPPTAAPPVETVTPKPPAIRPSFNCANASLRVEFLICESPLLADLDRSLASSYKRAMAAAGANSRALQTVQRQWRRETRDVCPDTECVATVVRERISVLKEIAARGSYPGTAPERPDPTGPEVTRPEITRPEAVFRRNND